MFLPFSSLGSFLWLSLAAFSSTPNSDDKTLLSGGNQYIHEESSDRQYLLHHCFRQSSIGALHMSGIIGTSKAAYEDSPFRALEIGCGAGHTTLDLLNKVLSQQAKITAVDTDASMIDATKARLRQMDSNNHLKIE